MRFKFIYYFVPSFIFIYLVISLLARTDLFPKTNEIFPFFSFDLYSYVPNEISQFDLRFNCGQKTESYLYFDNDTLNKIESKFYRAWVQDLGEDFENTGIINVEFIKNIVDKTNTVELISFEGKYKNMMNSTHEVRVVKKIK